MLRRTRWATALVLFLGAFVAAQAQESYLHSFIVQVKPEKRMEFDALAKKIATANRQHGGDTWVTDEAAYGEQNTIHFVRERQSYGEIEKATSMFMSATG
jgi:hypothetical protein